jgi:hypothetical protein
LKWEPATGDERHRRGLYIHFQRTVPFPMLATFDAPESNVTCTRRERSNSPLQALTLWNNESFTECARAFGHRIAGSSADLDRRLSHGFRLATDRAPTERELSRLRHFWAGQRRMFEKDPDAARRICGSAHGVEEAQAADTATCIALARVLLNLDETITRE